MEAAIRSKNDFDKQEKAWASSLVSDQRLTFRHNFLWFKDGLKISIWCNSFEECQEKKRWRGIRSIYNTYKTDLMATSKQPHRGILWLPQQEMSWRNSLRTSRVLHCFTTRDLVEMVEKHQPERPSNDLLRPSGKNRRVHKGTPGKRCFGSKPIGNRLKGTWVGIEGMEGVPYALKV